jgi:hypothetical protein
LPPILTAMISCFNKDMLIASLPKFGAFLYIVFDFCFPSGTGRENHVHLVDFNIDFPFIGSSPPMDTTEFRMIE